jgi:hypothetical protein
MFEHRKLLRPLARCGLALWLVSLLLVQPAVCFDTAPHYDLTQAVLTERGFGSAAIKIAQAQNWMTDYYTTAPSLRRTDRREQKLLEQLHCDNLDTAAQVKHYLGWLLDNVKNASQQAAQKNNPLDTLTILAMSLHAVQDFYAHSNWVELHPRTGAAYRTETFLSDPAGLSPQIMTGKVPPTLPNGLGTAALPADAVVHGGYANGLNKDSPVRPGWDEAYVFAYAASYELVALIEKWSEEVQPGYWNSVKRLQIEPQEQARLERDLEAARCISMWVALDSGVDGHWKGDKSGAHHLFTAFLGRWEAADSSVFARQIKDGRILGQLAENLSTQATPPDLPVTSGFLLRRRALVVRTDSIRAINDGGPLGRLERIDLNGEADFYALFRVGQQTYRERVIQGKDSVTNPWYVIHFVDQSLSEIPLNIAVWDEDESEPGEGFRDDPIDINPQPRKYDLDFVINATDPGKTFSLSGAKPDKNRAAISFTVTQIPLR